MVASRSPALSLPLRGTRGAARAQTPPALRAGEASRLGFVLFVLLNAALFLRPAEIFLTFNPRLYEILIIACVFASLGDLPKQLNLRGLPDRPITVCVLGLLAAVVLSHLSHFAVKQAAYAGFDFFKIALYYLLLVSLVDTPARVRSLVLWIALFIVAMSVATVLQYHHLINLPALEPYAEKLGGVDDDGAPLVVYRLRSVGIFNDPNDFCLVLLFAGGAFVQRFATAARGLLRILWLAPVAVCVYAFSLTYSRGGFLGLLGGVAAFTTTRFGWRKMVPMMVLAVPVIVFLFGGRQTDINATEGTGQGRIQLWAESLHMFRHAPLFGGGTDQLSEELGFAAHNSFVHAYAELGFLGGTLFLSAFVLSLRGLHGVRHHREAVGEELYALAPYFAGILVAAAALLFTISRVYVTPTYLILGLAAAYLRLAPPATTDVRLDFRRVRRLIGLSVVFLIALHLFVGALVRWTGGA